MIRDLSERIRIERARNRFTQKELGERIGVDSSMISLYEKGGATPSADVLAKMAVAFDVSLDYLAGLNGHDMLNIDGLLDYQINILRTTAQDFRELNKLKTISK